MFVRKIRHANQEKYGMRILMPTGTPRCRYLEMELEFDSRKVLGSGSSRLIEDKRCHFRYGTGFMPRKLLITHIQPNTCACCDNDCILYCSFAPTYQELPIFAR